MTFVWSLVFAFRFLLNELQLPSSFDRLSFLSHYLGLSYNSRALSAQSLFAYSCYGAGLRGLVTDKTDDGITKILVEVITNYEGMYGLVLICLGIGCTVWYTFAQGLIDRPRSHSF